MKQAADIGLPTLPKHWIWDIRKEGSTGYDLWLRRKGEAQGLECVSIRGRSAEEVASELIKRAEKLYSAHIHLLVEDPLCGIYK